MKTINGERLLEICNKHIETLRSMQEKKDGWDSTILGARIAEIERLMLYIETEPEALVRCKDCRWYDKGENVVDSWELCKRHKHNTRDDGYCHHGERRED